MKKNLSNLINISILVEVINYQILQNMPRIVTDDQTLFSECIDVFRNEFHQYEQPLNLRTCDYILTPFKIISEWNLPNCKINPSQEIEMAPGIYSFISLVQVPDNLRNNFGHQFCQALATVISFVTLRTIKTPRSREYNLPNPLNPIHLKWIGSAHPIITAGIGATKTTLSEKEEAEIIKDLHYIINKLLSTPMEQYVIFMQSIRLIYLSLNNKKDDFGLAYSLIVASIESVAQKVIKRDKVKEKHSQDKVWSEFGKKDPTFFELYNEYKRQRGFNQYLKERYVMFILTYAPVIQWTEYVEHPLEDVYKFLQEPPNSIKIDPNSVKFFSGISPEEITDENIRNILRDTYTHRSQFFHRGQQPPHHTTFNKQYFEDHTTFDFENRRETTVILPNYQLLLAIAKNSIANWLFSETAS